MAVVRADPAVCYRLLVTRLKSQAVVPILTAAEQEAESQTIWARILNFEFSPQPKANGDDEDLVRVAMVLGIAIDPERIADEGAYAPAAAAAQIHAVLDEYSVVEGAHALDLDRAGVKLDEPIDLVTELVLGTVTVEGLFRRTSGSTLADHLQET